jgi:hypothetical protein
MVWIRQLILREPFLSDLVLRYKKLRFGKNRKGNIAMFHMGRCGSQVLGNMLDQHPQIRWDGEIFENMGERYHEFGWEKERVKKILQWRRDSEKCSFYGFETKSLPEQHLRSEWINMPLPEYIEFLYALGFNYFIILKRHNYLKRAVSERVASETGEWHRREEANRITKIYVDTSNFWVGNITKPLLRHFEELDRQYQTLSKALSSHRMIELCYEDDILNDPFIAYNKVCEFLALEACPVEVNLKKTNPFQMESVIVNFEEVSQVLVGSKYEWMLSDGGTAKVA